MTRSRDLARRRFLRYLAASPALPWLLSQQGLAQSDPAASFAGRLDKDPDGLSPEVLNSLAHYEDEIAAASDAITVFDLEAAARKRLHVGHQAYLTSVEDQLVSRTNRQGFDRFEVRSRRLTGTASVDTSTTLFGVKWNTPLVLCPAGFQGAFSADAEVAVARAARSRQHLQVLSTMATRSIEDVTEARGQALWFQLYRNEDWNRTRAMIRRAEATGSPVMVYTIDTVPGNSREILAKIRRQNIAFCKGCHAATGTETLTNQISGAFGSTPYPMLSTPGLGPPMLEGPPTWDYVKRLKDTTSMKVIVKGIVTRDDAELAIEHGADGIWVSNHGGMQESSGRSSIESLEEVVPGVRRRTPIIVDGGFRRGRDIFKALALGASVVGVGRPYLWGLAAFGQDGVQAALDILDYEFRTFMAQAGAASVTRLTSSFLIKAS